MNGHSTAFEELKKIVGKEDYLKLTAYLIATRFTSDSETNDEYVSIYFKILHKHNVPKDLWQSFRNHYKFEVPLEMLRIKI